MVVECDLLERAEDYGRESLGMEPWRSDDDRSDTNDTSCQEYGAARQSRFFVGRMVDNVLCRHPICENTFIQVSDKIAPGVLISPQSVYGNPKAQFSTEFSIYQDNSHNWWVTFNGEPVGYYPDAVADIDEADTAVWGGMVERVTSNSQTGMGNGHFPEEGPGKTGLIYQARVKKADLGDMLEAPSSLFVTRPGCYNIENVGPDNENQGYSYRYGGPGKNPNCNMG